MLYRKAISDKSDEEIIALVIKQRTEAAVEFQRSIEHSLEQLSRISSEFEPSNQKRKENVSLKRLYAIRVKCDVLDFLCNNVYYIIY